MWIITSCLTLNDEPSQRSYKQAAFIIYQFVAWLAIFFCALATLVWSNELTDALLCTPLLCGSFHIISKRICVLKNENRVKYLLFKLENLVRHHMISPRYSLYAIEKETWNQHLTIAVLLCNSGVHLFTATYYVTCYLIGVNTGHSMFQLWTPWKDQESIVMDLALVLLVVTPGALIAMVFYVMLFTVTSRLSGLIQILQASLEDQGFVKQNRNLHVEIIHLVDMYKNIFAGQIYLEVVVSSFQPCAYGHFLLRALKQHDPAFFDLSLKFIVALLLPFTLCACGEEISSQLERLHTSAYASRWYERDSKHWQNLIILMSVTKQPRAWHYLTLMKLNLACFVTLIQGTYSYLTMIENLEKIVK